MPFPRTALPYSAQLYNLDHDPGENHNLYAQDSERSKEMRSLLKMLKSSGRSAPKSRKPIGPSGIPRLN